MLSVQYISYIFFAVISTILNVGIQKVIEIILNNYYSHSVFINKAIQTNSNITYGLLLKMITATIIAFIFKYIADKLLIFKDKTEYISKKHFKQIFLYGFFAVFTTLIFWGTELLFKFLFKIKNIEYIGAVIGLAIGYTLKYLLDKKYVFNS